MKEKILETNERCKHYTHSYDLGIGACLGVLPGGRKFIRSALCCGHHGNCDHPELYDLPCLPERKTDRELLIEITRDLEKIRKLLTER